MDARKLAQCYEEEILPGWDELFGSRLTEHFPGARVVGADLSAGMLDEAADRLGDAVGGLVRSDAQRLPFRPGSMDAVTCVESFHWYPDQTAAAREVAAVLLERTGFEVEHQRRVPRFGPLPWPVLTEARRT